MSNAKRTAALLLSVARTDSTFERVDGRDGPSWVGKCIHCRSKLVLDEDGTPISAATVEHIVPRNKGGTDAAENLAIACARCNHGKGIRIDQRRTDDPTYARVVDALREERRRRWRDG